jgi:uncharacterized protein YdaU (DUF1376 family)
VNYFELHLGDYAEATQHLTLVEDGVYGRLLRKYYATEKPLPTDVGAVQRLIGAKSKEERAAVQSVLDDFFDLRDDGWHNKRADEEIAAFQEGEPEREVKKGNEDLRLKRHREERAALFRRLNAVGQHASWNTPIKDLRDLVAKVCGDEPATGTTKPATPPATATATPATATQTPAPSTHLPDTTSQTPGIKPPGDDPAPVPTPVGAVGLALRKAGMPAVNTAHPTLLALLEAGVTVEEFVAAVPATQGKREDAAKVAATTPRGKTPNRQEAQEERNRTVAQRWAQQGEPHAAE